MGLDPFSVPPANWTEELCPPSRNTPFPPPPLFRVAQELLPQCLEVQGRCVDVHREAEGPGREMDICHVTLRSGPFLHGMVLFCHSSKREHVPTLIPAKVSLAAERLLTASKPNTQKQALFYFGWWLKTSSL